MKIVNKNIILGICVCCFSIKTVYTQQINLFFQNSDIEKLKRELITGKDTNSLHIGEIYTKNIELKQPRLKSAVIKPPSLLYDSLKVYTFYSEVDSILKYFNARQYNANNQVTNMKLFYDLDHFKENIYTYINNNTLIRLLENLYIKGEFIGSSKTNYQYNIQKRLFKFDVNTNRCLFKRYKFNWETNRWEYEYFYFGHDFNDHPTGSTCDESLDYRNEEEFKYIYSIDSMGRDTNITLIQFNTMGDYTIRIKYQYITSLTYNDIGTISKKSFKVKAAEGVDYFEPDTLWQYNESGQLVYFWHNDHRKEYKSHFKTFEYDSNHVLRNKKEYSIYFGDTLIKETNIRDTLSSAYALYTDKYNYSEFTIKDKSLLLAFYNSHGLISNTRKYLMDSNTMQWKLLYYDTLIYNNNNQITGYYLGAGSNNITKYQYKELYFYDEEGNKTRYEEYRMNMSFGYFSPVYKEYYYYKRNQTSLPNNIFIKNIEVYPNPTRNYITVSSKQAAGNLIFKLFSINGVILDIGTLTRETGNIDVSMYPAGFYFLELSCKDKDILKQTFKIVKQ